MNGLITESEWKGKTLQEAVSYAKIKGFTHRIVEEDGVSKMIDPTPKNNRVNLRVRNGVIIGAYPG
jgi:hypothetical protein